MILSASQILEFRLEMESLICEREAMIAFNKEREHQGFQVGYDEKAFYDLGKKFQEIHNRMIYLLDK